MAQKTKLEIIGPYTPEHEGPFCMRNKTPVEILTKKDRYGKILGYEGDRKELTTWEATGQLDLTRMSDTPFDLMNAREVPVAREFWIVGGLVFSDEKEARRIHTNAMSRSEIIHVREVLPGEE